MFGDNGDGLRVTRRIDQTSVSYLWDVAAGLPVVLQDSEGNTYVYGLDLISATDGTGDETYFTYDGLGSVADLTDENGDEIDDYTYDVFGEIRSQSGSSDNYWLFTGEQSDANRQAASTPESGTECGAAGTAAFGPIHSETLTQMGELAVSGVQETLSCAR